MTAIIVGTVDASQDATVAGVIAEAGSSDKVIREMQRDSGEFG
jgi:hypothetical protein